MLGQRRRYLAMVSFAMDVGAGIVLLLFTFLFLRAYEKTWESILQTLTGYPFRIENVSHLESEGWLFLLILFMLLMGMRLSGFYRYDHHSAFSRWFFASLKGVFIGVATTALVLYFLGITDVNRSLVFLFAVVFTVYIWIKTAIWHQLLRNRERVKQPIEVLLVTPENRYEEAQQLFQRSELTGMRVKKSMFIGESSKAHRDDLNSLDNALRDTLVKDYCDVVWLIPGADPGEVQMVTHAVEEAGIPLWYFLPKPFSELAEPRMDMLFDRPLLVYSSTPQYDARLIIKRSFDLILATTLIVGLFPVFLVIAALIKSLSPGPLFYRQWRTGWRGRPFKIWKFRTMTLDSEYRPRLEDNLVNGPAFKAKDDPRVTPVGRWLRRFSLDELPQLMNVIAGEMSLVGPRPLPIEETHSFSAFRDHRRYSVLPGMTGLWQISGRTEIPDFEDWVKLDLYYIDHWSLWLDVKILCRTLPVVLSGEGAR